MHQKKILLLLIIIHNYCFSQVGGEQTYQFLNTCTSARQIAIGGKSLTLTDNINQPFYNPATITNTINKYISGNFSNYLAGTSIGSLAYAHKFNKLKAPIYTNITYLNYGKLIGADKKGVETGDFNASDAIFTIGYSFAIPKSNIKIGTNIKFIHSAIEKYNSYGITTDIGILYNKNNSPLTISLVGRNIGTQIKTYNDTKEKLPFEVALGSSYTLQDVPLRWHITLENLQKWKVATPNPSNDKTDLEGNKTTEKIHIYDQLMRHTIIGAELFPKSKVNLRLGYNFRRGKELKLQNVRSFGGISAGFGLQLKRFKLNYAYSKFHSATNTNTFSLIVDLNYKEKEKPEEELENNTI